VLLHLMTDLALAGGLVYLRSSGLLRFLSLFMPDVAWVARLSGGFGAIWAVVRTGLMLISNRK